MKNQIDTLTDDHDDLVPEILTDDALIQEAPRGRSITGQALAKALGDRRGMTLVEIMIVLTILAGIMVTVGVYAFDALDRAKMKDTHLKLQKVSSKVQEYYAFQSPNVMPDNLEALTNPPSGEPPYLKPEDIKDAWGQEISFDRKGDRSYTLRSPGPDGSDGSQDDIVLED